MVMYRADCHGSGIKANDSQAEKPTLNEQKALMLRASGVDTQGFGTGGSL
jgi:hypothetical protein